eukprot:3378262-Rhodomonas_salina.1
MQRGTQAVAWTPGLEGELCCLGVEHSPMLASSARALALDVGVDEQIMQDCIMTRKTHVAHCTCKVQGQSLVSCCGRTTQLRESGVPDTETRTGTS